jgi:two-component system response regulator PrrA
LPLVLIVDDDASVADTFARILRLEGYDVLTALTTEAALRAVDQSHPDAILLDLLMPVEDGVAFLRRLRAQEVERRTPVAIITGDYFARETIGRELNELHAVLYFKPVWIADLVEIARRLLSPGP